MRSAVRICLLYFTLAISGCEQQQSSSNQGSGIVIDNSAAEAEARRIAAEQAAAAARLEIERILNEDARAGRPGSVEAIASAMRGINIDSSPPDFREAYFIHIQAWEDAARIDGQLRYLNSQAASDEAWRRWWIETFRNSNQTPVSDLESAKAQMRDRLAAANETIRTTFQAVERIAVRYGARLPSSVSQSGNAM